MARTGVAAQFLLQIVSPCWRNTCTLRPFVLATLQQAERPCTEGALSSLAVWGMYVGTLHIRTRSTVHLLLGGSAVCWCLMACSGGGCAGAVLSRLCPGGAATDLFHGRIPGSADLVCINHFPELDRPRNLIRQIFLHLHAHLIIRASAYLQHCVVLIICTGRRRHVSAVTNAAHRPLARCGWTGGTVCV